MNENFTLSNWRINELIYKNLETIELLSVDFKLEVYVKFNMRSKLPDVGMLPRILFPQLSMFECEWEC